MADSLYSFVPSKTAKNARDRVLRSADTLLALLTDSIRESQPDETPLGVDRVPLDDDEKPWGWDAG